MGKTFDLGYLDEDESVQILTVLENDFQLRMKERARLGKLRRTINEDDKLATVLSSQNDFNENNCIRCYKSFFILFNPKFICFACKFNVCKNCCTFYFQFRSFVCITCQKEKDVMAQSCNWFYETVQRKFRRCGSVKVARTLSICRKNQELRRTGRSRPTILDAFTQDKNDEESDSGSSSNDGIKPIEEFCIDEVRERCIMESDESDVELHAKHHTHSPHNQEEEGVEDEKLRKMRQFEEAFPEARQPRRFNEKQATDFHVRGGETEENSQKNVLRRMKAMQMARFHEKVHDVMTQIRSDLRERYPNNLPSPRKNQRLRQFVRKSREELTAVLRNFSQILAITIESHNLAVGRSSEDVHIDIQYILQDEVEAIVSRRIDVNFDETTSLFTDEGSKLSAPGAVEQRLAGIILKKIFDEYRVVPQSSLGPEEMAVLRELDHLIDEAEVPERYSSSSSRRPTEVDPDLLSISESGIRQSRKFSDSGQLSQSGSQYSAGSSSQWLIKGRPSAATAGSMSGLGKAVSPKVGGRASDELSDLSGGSEEERDDISEYHNTTDLNQNIWTGTSGEEKKKEVLQHLRQRNSEINVQYDASPPSSAGPFDQGQSKIQRRIDTLSRDVMTASKKTEGAAAAVENTAEQMENIFAQLSALNRQVSNLSVELTPAKALRQSSDMGVNTAARALQHVRNKPFPFPTGNTFPPEQEEKEVEEDIYIKAAEMADLIALIEDLEGALSKDSAHTQGSDCPHHLQRWSSIEGHVVSTVERLEGDLRDVDNIGARVTSLTSRGTRNRSTLDNSDVRQRKTSGEVLGVRRSSSDVNFGVAAQRYDPWLRGQTSRDAWDDYRHSNKRTS